MFEKFIVIQKQSSCTIPCLFVTEELSTSYQALTNFLPNGIVIDNYHP